MPVQVVQEAHLTVGSALTTWNFSFPSEVAQGNVVVIAIRTTTANRTPNAPTSSGSATFASVATIGGTSANHLRMWSAVEGANNKDYSVTISGSLSAAGLLQAWEISGASSATPTASGTGRQDTVTTEPAMVDIGLNIPSGGIMLGMVASQVGSWTTITGTPANFANDYSIPSAYAGSNTTASTAVRGIVTVTTARAAWGVAAVWSQSAANFNLAADVGALTVTGQAANTNAAALLIADQGALALAGQAANTNAAAALAADFAAITLTGQAAGISAAAIFSADFGALVATGQAAGVNAAASLTAEAGALALTGQAAALTVGATLPADAGALLFSGQDATLTVSIPITAGPLAVFQAQVSQPGPLAVQVDSPGPQAAQISQPGPLAVQL
jgi:hypothetical protein